ncbi:hypothetical protein AVEN_163594-1 [Araneus ventricosus]|uniref:Uncharacterized protein n=1 Tax=Araneus ventricosus TaxID=182803 RepID=A0A4Y2S776_ARAVE|nr:hypothetical protein AVEN_163594-1 [Araneus ventricosus]
MLVLGTEPGQEGRLWATSRSRFPVDGAAIASDVRESSCREHSQRQLPVAPIPGWRQNESVRGKNGLKGMRAPEKCQVISLSYWCRAPRENEYLS